jgi:hypothetical protein
LSSATVWSSSSSQFALVGSGAAAALSGTTVKNPAAADQFNCCPGSSWKLTREPRKLPPAVPKNGVWLVLPGPPISSVARVLSALASTSCVIVPAAV